MSLDLEKLSISINIINSRSVGLVSHAGLVINAINLCSILNADI